MKSKKYKKVKEDIKPPVTKPWGGHILDPEDCIRKDKIFGSNDRTWIDAALCHSCENQKQCSTYKKWKGIK